MKRSSKIILAISLLLVISVWGLNFFELSTILVPYAIMIVGIATHAAYTILSSVYGLKDHP